MAADVSRNLAAAGGMADMDGILQIESLDQRREIVSVGVHIVPVPGLTRAAVTATIVGDASISARRQKEHLVLERVGRERPAMAEHYRLSTTPVVVVNVCTVFGRDGAHISRSFV